MSFLHDGIPMPTRKAVLRTTGYQPVPEKIGHGLVARDTFFARVTAALSHPNIASKHWIIRQYDHEVQGGSVIKPLVGPLQIGPSDASVIRPKLTSHRGVAIGCGLAPHIIDPYDMAIAAIDEAVRNVVCVGADYNQIAILDNFCWPSVDDEITMGTLVRACEACRDAALAFGIPFISGKDSLHNQFTNQETGEVTRIPPTLLISAIGIVENVGRCITMDLKNPGGLVCLVSAKNPADLKSLAQTHRLISQSIAAGEITACHDVSDGGIAVAAAEMCIASGLGMLVSGTNGGENLLEDESAFTQSPGRYLIELRDAAKFPEIRDRVASSTHVIEFGIVQQSPMLTMKLTNHRTEEIPLEKLTTAWRGTLDW